MEKSFILGIFRAIVTKIRQSFCDHTYAFVKVNILIGRLCSVQVCTKCRKMVITSHCNEFDRDRLLTDMVFGKLKGQK